MMRLECVRLVHWFHFEDEAVPLGGSCLLLGDNGSGKTTILDALQVGLVADFSEVLFNRAANEKSRRTLYGYVRWKIGSEDESEPGGVKYGRPGCSAYVALEFRDDHDPSLAFTAGMCFEATESDQHVAKLFFVAPSRQATEIEAVISREDGQREVRTLKDFRAWLRAERLLDWSDAATYREELRQRLGVLPESFHRLIVKALAFKPIGQVKQFAFDYLLDPRPIDTAALQANLDHYKHLEGEAREAEERITELAGIVERGERVMTEQRVADGHQFMELRAIQDVAGVKVESVEAQLATDRALLAGSAARRDEIKLESEALEREWERLLTALDRNDVFRKLRDLERQAQDAERTLGEAREADAEARSVLRGQTEALDLMLSDPARALRKRRESLFDKDDLLGAEEAPEIVARLRHSLDRQGALAGRDLLTWQGRLDRADNGARAVRLRLQQEKESVHAEATALRDEQKALEAGRLRYPDGAAALLHLLSARLKGARDPRPLCELIEVNDLRWRDAVEGYLGGRRHDVIVAPEDYARALSLYERNKRDYLLPGRGPVFMSGVGLVDIDRIIRSGRGCQPRSLAEKVDTDDRLARAYVDHVLGGVVCVDDEQALRKYPVAITDTVMVYKDHVARQTAREVYSRHYIGAAARTRRLAEIATELADLGDRFVAASKDVDWLTEVIKKIDRARSETRRLSDLVARAEGVDRLEEELRRLQAQRALIDTSSIVELERARDEAASRRTNLRKELDALLVAIGELTSALKSGEVELDRAQEELRLAAAALEQFLAPRERELREEYHGRYVRERAQREPAEIHVTFGRQRKAIESRVGNLIVELVLLKQKYVERRGLGATIEGPGFEAFAAELEAWRESKLPAYRERIAEAKSLSLQRLTEDVVFRLRENLLQVRRQFDELNRGLKDVQFGSERYQFLADVNPAHRAFYNLVMDASPHERESLFDASGSESSLRDQLQALLDRLLDAEARDVRTELEARADYREYFVYDLRISHADGGHSLYDKVAGDKSGGETQTPYYIAVMASMYRVYRGRKGGQEPTCGLILLDEAFGKMDESRIRATLTFARRLKLQLILAAPKERSELVAPHVERSLLIHKDPGTGLPTVLDFTKELSQHAAEEQAVAIASGGAPHEAARGP